MPPDPPSLVCLCELDIHVTPLLKILATGLYSIWVQARHGKTCKISVFRAIFLLEKGMYMWHNLSYSLLVNIYHPSPYLSCGDHCSVLADLLTASATSVWSTMLREIVSPPRSSVTQQQLRSPSLTSSVSVTQTTPSLLWPLLEYMHWRKSVAFSSIMRYSIANSYSGLRTVFVAIGTSHHLCCLLATSVHLTWVAPCHIRQYHIYYRGTCGTYVDEGRLDTDHQEHTFDGLQEGINYSFTVNQTGFSGGTLYWRSVCKKFQQICCVK